MTTPIVTWDDLAWPVILTPYYLTAVAALTLFRSKEQAMEFIRSAAKAVVAVIVGAATSFAASQGFDLTDAQVAAITAFLTGLIVYIVPNKSAAGE